MGTGRKRLLTHLSRYGRGRGCSGCIQLRLCCGLLRRLLLQDCTGLLQNTGTQGIMGEQEGGPAPVMVSSATVVSSAHMIVSSTPTTASSAPVMVSSTPQLLVLPP